MLCCHVSGMSSSTPTIFPKTLEERNALYRRMKAILHTDHTSTSTCQRNPRDRPGCLTASKRLKLATISL